MLLAEVDYTYRAVHSSSLEGRVRRSNITSRHYILFSSGCTLRVSLAGVARDCRTHSWLPDCRQSPITLLVSISLFSPRAAGGKCEPGLCVVRCSEIPPHPPRFQPNSTLGLLHLDCLLYVIAETQQPTPPKTTHNTPSKPSRYVLLNNGTARSGGGARRGAPTRSKTLALRRQRRGQTQRRPCRGQRGVAGGGRPAPWRRRRYARCGVT